MAVQNFRIAVGKVHFYDMHAFNRDWAYCLDLNEYLSARGYRGLCYAIHLRINELVDSHRQKRTAESEETVVMAYLALEINVIKKYCT